MKPLLTFALGLGLACLFGCGTTAPLAPVGFDKKPANSPETVASLLGTGDHTPAAPSERSVVSDASLARSTVAHANIDLPFVISDYAMPSGWSSVPNDQQQQLVEAAKSAMRVVLFVRGDQVRASRANRQRMMRRGIEIKRFLVSQGVASAKIRIFVRSAGAFVADNSTADGRARNRRVEIHFKG